MRQAGRRSGTAAALAAAAIALALAALTAPPAGAATVRRVTPQGETAQPVRQVGVTFAQPEVAFGDPRLPDPFVLACRKARVQGTGRWADARTWLYDFSRPLPPGTVCTLKANAGWKPLTGPLAGPAEYTFSTGGPAVVAVQPAEGATIEEDQHFVLRLSGPAVAASVEAHARCEVEGIGEALAVRVVAGAARERILASLPALSRHAADVLVLACQRPLPPEARLRLVWGRGIAAAADPAVVTRVEQRHDYAVRPLFKAEFSCERERAGAPCLPIRPLTLAFSSPIPREVAAAVRLRVVAGSGSGSGSGGGGGALDVLALLGLAGVGFARFLRFRPRVLG
jgi:hypothetical protein